MESQLMIVGGPTFLSPNEAIRHRIPSLQFSSPAISPFPSFSGDSGGFYWSKNCGHDNRKTRVVRRFCTTTSALIANSNHSKSKVHTHTVGDFMTRREKMHVVKPLTTIDEALETLVESKISGFPVIDDDWNLVGVVSDYDLLALDSISGTGLQLADGNLFPEVDSSWKVFNELQRLLGKTNGRFVADVMTPAPLVVRENTNLEDAARLLLETRYRRLPVVDADGKLVGIVTRGNVIRAALDIKRRDLKDTDVHQRNQ